MTSAIILLSCLLFHLLPYSLFKASLSQYDVILIAQIMNFWTWKGSVPSTCGHKLQQPSNTINIYPFTPACDTNEAVEEPLEDIDSSWNFSQPVTGRSIQLICDGHHVQMTVEGKDA